MNIDQQRIRAMNACISIANDYSEEEVERFAPPSVQVAWKIGDEFLEHALKEEKKLRKNVVI